jgi:hypothetical protein
MYCLLEVVAIAREALAARFTAKLSWIKVSFVEFLFLSSDRLVWTDFHCPIKPDEFNQVMIN